MAGNVLSCDAVLSVRRVFLTRRWRHMFLGKVGNAFRVPTLCLNLEDHNYFGYCPPYCVFSNTFRKLSTGRKFFYPAGRVRRDCLHQWTIHSVRKMPRRVFSLSTHFEPTIWRTDRGCPVAWNVERSRCSAATGISEQVHWYAWPSTYLLCPWYHCKEQKCSFTAHSKYKTATMIEQKR